MDSTNKSLSTVVAVAILCVSVVSAEPPLPQNGIRPSNILGGAGQHASFSFIRPGLTQTSYAFNGPSSHQAFSSSIGNPNLAQKTLPNVANALAYRNPGLGYFPTGPVNSAFASAPSAAAAPIPNYHQPPAPVSGPPHAQVYQGAPAAPPSQGQTDQVAALQAYLQQQYQQQFQQQYQQQYQQALQYQALQNAQTNQGSSSDPAAAYHAQLQALRQAQVQAAQSSSAEQLQQQIPEQIKLQQSEENQQQQEQQTQNLLGIAYSSAPSVAHVKVSGNGYKFDF